MSNSNQKFWEDSNFSQKENKEEISKDVQQIIDLYKLLSVENRVEVKKIIREINVFN